MKLTINGQTVEVKDDPPRLLIWVLREELGLMGTKYGCGAGICGSCAVLVDGEAIRTCVTPIAAVADKEIQTIEGLGKRNEDGTVDFHPIQQAFIEHQAPQCSWCMSGQMITAVALLDENPNPTEDEIVEAMAQNYCRCGAYVRIKSAIMDAAQAMNGGGTS